MSHTPTPWSWNKRKESLIGADGERVVVYSSGLSFASLPDRRSVANTDFIVEAVNSHDVLVRENRQMYEALKLIEHKIDQHLQGQYPDGKALGVALMTARAALQNHESRGSKGGIDGVS